MVATSVTVLLVVVLPWIIGALLLRTFSSSEAHDNSMWHTPAAVWIVVFPALLIPPFFIWDSQEDGSSAHAVKHVVEETVARSWDTLVHMIRYLIPFAIYPTILFWIKIIVNKRADAEEQGQAYKRFETRSPEKQSQQAQLIGFVIKILVMIFVFFSALNQLGITTGDVLEITTVFSLGLSWSMRDWLSSLWAAFMIAMTTELTSGSVITTDPLGEATRFEVVRTGLLYIACVKLQRSEDKTPPTELELVYFANSALLNRGFSVILKPVER